MENMTYRTEYTRDQMNSMYAEKVKNFTDEDIKNYFHGFQHVLNKDGFDPRNIETYEDSDFEILDDEIHEI